VPTTIDFHKVAFAHPDFVAGDVSTVSVEREWDLSGIAAPAPATDGAGAVEPSRTFTVEVGGKRLEVALFEPDGVPAAPARAKRERGGGPRGKGVGSAMEVLVAPMQGTIVKTVAEVGQAVAAGDLVLVLEAMKMENHITAHRDGVLTELHVGPGDVVNSGDALGKIEDAGGDADDPRRAPDVD
jgi:acetyl-CoA/propionyl-CoA carboxylase, biotin carboxylase, biotin carboxyl carrier protein